MRSQLETITSRFYTVATHVYETRSVSRASFFLETQRKYIIYILQRCPPVQAVSSSDRSTKRSSEMLLSLPAIQIVDCLNLESRGAWTKGWNVRTRGVSGNIQSAFFARPTTRNCRGRFTEDERGSVVRKKHVFPVRLAGGESKATL